MKKTKYDQLKEQAINLMIEGNIKEYINQLKKMEKIKYQLIVQ